MRIEALSFFRFPAALLVVFFHCGSHLNLASDSHIKVGWPITMIYFFVLSGFVNTIAYYKRNNYSVTNFWLNRFARIYPLYLFALVMCIFALHLEVGLENVNRVGKTLFLNLTFLKIWSQTFAGTLNSASWAVCLEMFFYLTFPLFMYLLKRKKYNPNFVLIISVVICIIVQIAHTFLRNSSLYLIDPQFSLYFFYFFPLNHLMSFVIGIAGGFYIVEKFDGVTLPRITRYIILISVSVVILLLNYYKDSSYQLVGLVIPYYQLLFSPFWLIFIISITLLKDSCISTLLSKRFFVILGDSSYGIFILQEPVYHFFKLFIFPVLNINGNYQFYLYLFTLIIISIITFYSIEKPFSKLIIATPSFFSRLFRKEKQAKI